MVANQLPLLDSAGATMAGAARPQPATRSNTKDVFHLISRARAKT